MDSSDLFKNENGMSARKTRLTLQRRNPTLTIDSVDLLLQEMGTLAPGESHGISEVALDTADALLNAKLPTKPLSFHNHKSGEKDRDCNSSSDTYVSDSAVPETSVISNSGDKDFEGKEQPKEEATNFWMDVSQTVPYNNNHSDLDTLLPSKSIMKPMGTPGNSRKKSVAFSSENHLETLHHYYPSTEEGSQSPLAEKQSRIAHLWSEMDKEDHITESTSASPLPVPPPHTSNTITGLLSPQDEYHDDEVDISVLSEYRLSHKNYSNLSLDEKLNIFLSNHSQAAQDDLDEHLDKLNKAKKEETDVNIHHLSFQLENQHVKIESPLNVLYKTQGVQLRSAGSSQSSLQSLMDSNRYLQSDNIATLSRGIQFNDGIQGFPDYMAELIIPSTDVPDNEQDSSADMLTFGMTERSNHEPSSDEEDHFQDSFNHSYNLTEKSIMNLLNSASRVNLPAEVIAEEQKHTQETEELEILEQELNINLHSNEEPEIKLELHNLFVKLEPQDSQVKAEPEDSYIKSEDISTSGANENLSPVKFEPNEVMSKEEPELSFMSESLEKPLMKKKDQSDLHSEEEEIILKHDEYGDKFKKNSEQEHEPAGDDYSDDQSEHFERIEDVHDIQIHGDTFSEELEYADNASVHLVDRYLASKSSEPVRLVESNLGSPKKEVLSLVIDENECLNNGDIAKDATEDLERVRLETVYHTRNDIDEKSADNSSSSSDKFVDTSEIPIAKTLAPPKVNDTVNLKLNPASEDNITRRHAEEIDNSILANSSNILPPSNLMPPTLANLSRNLDPGSMFEESLSAEHDKDKKATDFISIWHSQSQKRKHELPRNQLTYKVPSILSYDTADLLQYNTYSIPVPWQHKKFKEVNVVSKKVVSPGFEDLQVSGFLPEISEDSGLEGHFRGLLQSQANQSELSTSSSTYKLHGKSFGIHNVLSQIDDSNVDVPPAPAPIQKKRLSVHSTLRPVSVVVKELPQRTGKKSKFHVPSFEIKRSKSTLSPKNFYNDIFEDSSLSKPTMKACGMKTLPSMDREDVKRIMQMKQAMSQEEYSNLKLVGTKKQSVIQEPADKYDKIQQLASLHCDSLMSSAPGNLRRNHNQLSHVIGELSSVPVAIESKDQIMKDLNIFQIKNDDPLDPLKEPEAAITTPAHHKKQDTSVFPDPDADLINNSEVSPINGSSFRDDVIARIDEIPNASLQTKVNQSAPLQDSPKKIHLVTVKRTPQTPPKELLLTRTSPIKINTSPVRLIKNGSSVTGVVLDTKTPKSAKEFEGSELTNEKIRNQGQDHGHGLSTPPVHSNSNNDTVINRSVQQDAPGRMISDSQGSDATSNTELERGRLFLRVVGLKNIELPDIKSRKGAFSITLDNGVHCIKTPNYKLDSLNVMIGKEFELTVGKSLEFILTMKATYDKPKGTLVEVKERKVVRSKNRISRMFGSKDIITTTKYIPQDVKDPWKRKFATDGSFARCYVDLEQYELQISGVARNFNITCFNEWETTSNGGVVIQRQPYKIAQLEVKMLFIPKTEPYEVLPTSIKSAYESLDELRSESHLAYEGYMHQDGGDCDTWKKRWFKLSGTSLIAHSEFSHKTRAKINLAKVVEVIYVDKENEKRSSGNYRNFSDILLVENAFKIRFANGEIIDFGAPNKREKLQWIKVIQEIVYRNKFRRQPWIQLMQEKNGNSRPRSIMAQVV